VRYVVINLAAQQIQHCINPTAICLETTQLCTLFK